MRGEHTRTIAPARALAAETLKLERLPSAERGMRSAECPAEIALMWQTAPPNVPSRCPREDRLARMQSEFTLK